MRKRGISGVISTVLIVLLVLVMISSVYLFYTNVLVYMLRQAELDIEFQSVRFEVVPGSIIVNEQGDLSFVLRRNVGGGTIDGFTVTLEDFSGNVVSIDRYVSTPLAELESMAIEIPHAEHGLEEIMRIQVFGVITDVETGKTFTSSAPITETLTPLAEERGVKSAGGGGGGGGGGGTNNNNDGGSVEDDFELPPLECGDGLCTFGEALTCSEDCINLVSNPGFDGGIVGWSGGSAATDGGESVLRTVSGSSSQTVSIDGEYDSFYLSYKVKPVTVTSQTAITLVPYLRYQEGGSETGLFYNWLRVGSAEQGQWTTKEHYIEVGKDLDQIRIQLFAQSGSEALFDDIVLVPMDTLHQTTLTNDYGEMTLGSYGFLKSLTVNGEQQINIPEPISNVKYINGDSYPASHIEQIGTNLYEMSYYDIDTKVQFSLDSGNSFYAFEIETVENADPLVVDDIEVMRFRPEFIAQLPDAAGAAAAKAKPDAAAFLNVVSTNENTLCELYPSHYTCRQSNHELLGWDDGGSFAILTTTKQNYFDDWEELAFETPAPYVTLDDGRWIKNSPRLRDSYFFADITPGNYLEMLDYAQRGNFRDLLVHGVFEGTYNQPYYPNGGVPFDPANNNAEFYDIVMQAFRNAGIDIGIHTFLNQIVSKGGLIDFVNPQNPDTEVYSGDLRDAFYTFELGQLTSDIGTGAGPIQIDANVLDNEVFAYYAIGQGRPSYVSNDPFFSNNYLIGNEIVRCVTYVESSQSTVFNCLRGAEGTTVSSHAAGTPFYFAPPQIGRFINPDRPDIKQLSIDGLWNMMDRLNVDYLYVDGYSDLPLPRTDLTESIAISHKRGILPYILERPDQTPHIQLGGSGGALAWSYIGRSASDDAGVFRNKEFTKKHKLEGIISRNNIYGPAVVGLDWWKVHGAGFSQYYDHDAVTFDDIDYVMGKVVGLDLPIGVQVGSLYTAHTKLGEIFDHMGLYNQLRDEDHSSPIIPQAVRNYLSDYDNEAELTDVAGWNFVKKDEFREYSTWDESSEYILNANNQFGAQPLYFELRPRFDYKGFNDPENLVLLDFTSGTPDSHIVYGEGGANCNLNANGVLTYTGGSSLGACIIRVDTLYSLFDRRGLGLRMVGNNNRELIVARYRSENSFSIRDFTQVVDFSGEQTLIFGNPDGDYQDYVDGTMVSGGPLGKPRHWDITTNTDRVFEIQVRNIQPGASGQLTFHEFKALKEKSGGLVSPEVTVGSTTLSFPLTLRIDDSSAYLLVYDGTSGTYTTYNSNYQQIGSGTVGVATVPSGAFSVSLSSDAGSSTYLTRGEFIVRTFDDEDRDGVPTDGSFGSGVVCTGSNNFCDDNDPNTFNPDQS